MNIRKAISLDAEAIANVHVKGWQTAYQNILSEKFLSNISFENRKKFWEQILSNSAPNQQVWVAEHEGKIIGFASGGKAINLQLPEYEGELYAIYILESERGKGMGEELFYKIKNFIKEKGMNNMFLIVLKENPYRKFYEKMGGIKIGEQTVKMDGKELEEYIYGWKL